MTAVERRAAAGGAHVDLTLLSRQGVVLDGRNPTDTLSLSVAGSAIARAALEPGASGFSQGRGLAAHGSAQLLGYFHSAGYSIYPGIGWSVVAGQDRKEALAAAASLRTKTLLVALLAALLIGAGAFVVARRFARPIEELVAASEAAATGDLTVRSGSVERTDELGRLARAFDAMIENLAELVGRISGAGTALSESATQMATNSTEVGSAVEEIARAVGDVAQGAERQMRMLDDARRAAEEMAERVHESARRAEESATTADGARTVAEGGVSAAERATEGRRGARRVPGDRPERRRRQRPGGRHRRCRAGDLRGPARLQQSVVEVAAVAEQSSASTEQVSASTEETAPAMQSIAAAAGGLLGTAEELTELVARFKLEAA